MFSLLALSESERKLFLRGIQAGITDTATRFTASFTARKSAKNVILECKQDIPFALIEGSSTSHNVIIHTHNIYICFP